MTFEDELTIIGNLAGAVARHDPHAGLRLSDRLVELLGDPPAAERAAKLRELAQLLVDFGSHFRARADELDPFVVDTMPSAELGVPERSTRGV